jgi:hypothetical protein
MSKNNLISLCRDCHIIQHRIGWFRFANRYPSVMHELMNKGWKFIDEFGVMKLRSEDVDTTV